MSTVTIELLAERDRRSIHRGYDIPTDATFVILLDRVEVLASDRGVPSDVEPRDAARQKALDHGADFVAPPLGVCFSRRVDGSWWGYRIGRGGGTGRGRRSTQPMLHIRQTAVAA